MTYFLPSQAIYRQTAGKYIFRTLGHESNLGNAPLQFVQNESQDVLVITSGNIGVGTNSPRSRLDVLGTAIVSQNIGIGTTMTSVGFEVWHSNAMLLPRGSTSARPDGPLKGYMRYNTDINVFEGFGAGDVWGSLGGVKSTDQLTFISAEESAGANDANIRFFTGGAQKMVLNPQGNLGIGTESPVVSLDIRTTDAVLLPRGTTEQRPQEVQQGYIRYNTETFQFEGLGGANQWGSLGGVKSTDQYTFISAEEYAGANDSNLRFVTGGAQRVVIDAVGNVGVGVSEPGYKLHVDGGIYADTILTSNLNVIGNLFTNYDSTIFRNRLQLAPLNTTIVIGENDNSNLDVQLVSEGLYKFLPNTTDVLLNGLKLAYMNSSSNDYTVSYELYEAYTLINIHLNDQVQPGDVVNITAWPQYLENTNILQPGYSLQQISYVTMDDSVLIDRTITKPLQVAPYRFVEHISSESAALALLQWTVSGRYIFSKNFCDVYLNGVKLINVAGTGIQDFDITYDYYFEQTRITFTLAHPLSLGDVLDVTIWPEYTDASSNIKGIFYQNYSYFSRVGVTSNIAFTEGNLGIGTTMPLKKLHIEDDIIFDGVMFNKVGQAIWMPGSALEWKTSAGEHPILTPSQSVSINITSKKGQFKYLGNNITYNVFFEAAVIGKTYVDGDYVLALQYLADMNSYAVGAVLGELWLTVTTATSITTYKAYAKVLSGGAGVALRYLNGTYEESLATLNIGSSIRLEGTLEYRTGYIADEVSLPKIWTPKGFSENIAGYVGLNNMAVPARARLDIVETAASNLPVLILDQRGSGPLLEMRSNMDDVKLIVDRHGNVGIGTTDPKQQLHITENAFIDGNVGIGVTENSSIYRLQVNGKIYASDEIYALSDIRMKTNIEPILNPLEKIARLSGFTYLLHDDNERHMGLSAQDVRAVAPEAVKEDEKGRLSVAYGNLVALLIEGIKELQSEMQKLSSAYPK